MRRVSKEYLKKADLPLIVEIGEGPRKMVREILDGLDLSGVLMLTGHTSYDLVGSKIEERISDILIDKFFVKKSGTKKSYRTVSGYNKISNHCCRRSG